jgi:hypothetical protein
VLALSFAPGWLTHHREVGGEGYRTLTLTLNAWQLRAFPVLSAAVVAALVTGLVAVAVPRVRRLLTPVVAVPLGLLVAAAVPIGHVAHVSRVSITPGWTLLGAFAAVIGMAAVIIRGSPPTGRLLVVAGAALLLVGAGGLAGRLVQLELAEGVRSHVVDGTYSREVGGVRRLLTLRDGTYSLDPWSGAVETAGISAIITGDAACPDARGFYHVRSAGGDRILWEKVVDTCGDGARAQALEGTWRPVADGDR